MKTIKDIDSKPSPFETGEIIPQDQLDLVPSYRKLFRTAVGIVTGEAGGEKSIDLFQIGMKLKSAGPDIDLENSEFTLLQEQCKKNPAQWIAHFHGQVLLKLKESEVAK